MRSYLYCKDLSCFLPFKRLANFRSFKFISSFVLLFTFNTVSFAAQVGDVYLKTVEVRDIDETFKPMDLYFTVDKQGKKKSIIQITSIEKNSALANVIKGEASPGELLVKRPPKPKKIIPASTTRNNVTPDSQNYESAEAPKPASKPMETTGRRWNDKRFRLGLGITSFQFQGSGAPGSERSLGYAVEALYNFRITGIKCETGLQYYQAGQKNTSSGFESILKMNYLGVPFLAKYEVLRPSSDMSLNIKGGAEIAYLLSGELSVEGSGLSIETSLTPSDRIDYLFVGGLELGTNVNDTGYWVELIYMHGLKNYEGSESNTYNNSGILLLVGVSF